LSGIFLVVIDALGVLEARKCQGMLMSKGICERISAIVVFMKILRSNLSRFINFFIPAYARASFIFVQMVLIGAAMTCTLSSSHAQSKRPRVIVLTDITNEPDDQESLVRFLVYCNEYDVEGLIATTSTWLRDRTSAKNIRQCVAAYALVKSNLDLHADGFPTAAQLASVTMEGWPEYGMLGVGAGKDSAGSDHIIDVIDRSADRPVWVTVWGGANCLAQALWKVRENRSAEELEKFISKIRVYTISDQDDAGPWMRKQFPKLFYVVSPGSEGGSEYNQATWTGISGDDYYLNGPRYCIDLVSNDWLTKNIRTNHGPLGAMYPAWEYIMEGDSPSFMNLINNGLGSAVSPGFGGWGGRYKLKQTYGDTAPIWQNSRDRFVTPDGRVHVTNMATIWRWRRDFQHDFAARMDWCVAKSFDDANHNPIVILNGDETKDVVYQKVKPGEKILLSAKGTLDPDGNTLSYRWFHYGEAGRGMTSKQDLWSIEIQGAETEDASLIVPAKFPGRTKDMHIILSVEDNGVPSLHAYRRIVLQLEN